MQWVTTDRSIFFLMIEYSEYILHVSSGKPCFLTLCCSYTCVCICVHTQDAVGYDFKCISYRGHSQNP